MTALLETKCLAQCSQMTSPVLQYVGGMRGEYTRTTLSGISSTFFGLHPCTKYQVRSDTSAITHSESPRKWASFQTWQIQKNLRGWQLSLTGEMQFPLSETLFVQGSAWPAPAEGWGNTSRTPVSQLIAEICFTGRHAANSSGINWNGFRPRGRIWHVPEKSLPLGGILNH